MPLMSQHHGRPPSTETSLPDGDGPAARVAPTDMDGAAARLGTVGFDGPDAANTTCRVEVDQAGEEHFRRGLYVALADREQGTELLGRIVAGPFHTPEDGAYHTHGTIEVLGRLEPGERIVPAPTRPRPGTEVTVFPASRLRHLLEIDGDLYLGRLTGHADVAVHAPSNSKNFLPRNVGVFGTVGSGKSNTAQVLIEEALGAGWAVVLVDVEGEYVRMDEPAADPRLAQLLEREHGLRPSGIRDLRVYVPSSGSSGAAAPLPFKVPLAGLDPEVVADIMELSEAERRVLGMATERAVRQYAPPPDAPPERPYSLQHLVDGLMEGASVVAGHATLRLLPYAKPADLVAAGTLRSKLLYLGRTDVLDWNETASVPELPVAELLVPGRLSVLDVSETDDRSRNLALAYVLQALFEQVIATPVGASMPSGVPRPPLLVVVEEVHTFVSRAAAPKMRAVLDNLQVISRRGRKRWMALALVSQQPNHVPDEIFELTNTRFIHQTKSLSNLEPIRQTTGSVEEVLWADVPALGPGRALLTGAVFPKPLFVDVRPARSRRLLTG